MRTLLIVDDNTFNLDFIGALLASLGYATVLANNGKEALGLAAKAPPDAIIMDIELDDDLGAPSGIDVTRALKADLRLAKIPIIALTGLDPAELGAQMATVGFSEIIRKPPTIAVLKAVLEKVLG